MTSTAVAPRTDRHTMPVSVALAVVVLGGGLSAGQSRINAELGHRIGSSLLAAVVSFGSGLVLVTALLLARPAGRRALAGWRGYGLAWWQYLGGVCGAAFVFIAAYTVPILGVGLMSVAQVTGQIAGALVVDRFGLSPSGRQALSLPRLGGAVLGGVAVLISAFGRPSGHLDLLALGLAVAAGFGISLQSAVNGRLNQAAGDPLVATTVNFTVGMLALLAGLAVVAVTGGVHSAALPSDWWLYLGGAAGVVFVTINVVTVRVLGVLRLGLAAVAGQLAGALALDALVPGGPGVSPMLAVGALLTVAAVAVAGLQSRPRR
ncbi:MAG TPA: DMT family transporter [Mycobacteriales bacterium]